MSEWELMDLMNSHLANVGLAFTAYLTLVFGFLAASYLVGHQLKKVEILIITGLYIFGSLVLAYATLAHMLRHYQLAEIVKQQLPELMWFNSITVIVVMGIVMVSGIISGIHFMYGRTRLGESQ